MAKTKSLPKPPRASRMTSSGTTKTPKGQYVAGQGNGPQTTAQMKGGRKGAC